MNDTNCGGWGCESCLPAWGSSTPLPYSLKSMEGRRGSQNGWRVLGYLRDLTYFSW